MLQVIDEINRTKVPYSCTHRAIVSQSPGLLEFGYVSEVDKCKPVLVYARDGLSLQPTLLTDNIKSQLVFSKLHGYYLLTTNCPQRLIDRETYELGYGSFPYSFNRKYEAVENFDLFNHQQKLVNAEPEFSLSKFMKYTFGLEFETSKGYIPEDICFRDGLIPLRDGSITGLEYSTIVLQGNAGLQFLSQQIQTLQEYTVFNKDCSLHIHFGGFPLEPEKLFNLYYLCKKLEPTLQNLTPAYTFHTSRYKSNDKEYCKLLESFQNFNDLYEYLVGKKFFGNLFQPHPNDLERKRKWQINTRYFWLNLINAICYNVNKTIEFRFLRPTYNLDKIILWMYIFNAILSCSENCTFSEIKKMNLLTALKKVYPEDTVSIVLHGMNLLQTVKEIQENDGDYIGSNIDVENRIFSSYRIR